MTYPIDSIHCLIYSERCIERGRMKCIQYWPENQETRQFATVDVSHEETLQFEDHVERVFWITHKRVRNEYLQGANENYLFDRKTRKRIIFNARSGLILLKLIVSFKRSVNIIQQNACYIKIAHFYFTL